MRISKETELMENYSIDENDGSAPFPKSVYQIIIKYKNNVLEKAYFFTKGNEPKIEDLPSSLVPMKDKKDLERLAKYFKKIV